MTRQTSSKIRGALMTKAWRLIMTAQHNESNDYDSSA
jgi:hypothetical protein